MFARIRSTPASGAYAFISMDPVAMVRHLDDPEAEAEAQALDS